MKYFVYDHHGDGFNTFSTKEEAKKFTQECLDWCVDNDYTDFIDIYWGEIKESVYTNDEVLNLKKPEQTSKVNSK